MTLDSDMVARLRRGEHEAWRSFLLAYHHVFERALYAGLQRLGDLPPPGEARRELVADAMSHFYQVFAVKFSTFTGEGPFRQFLFHSVDHFLARRRTKRATDAVRAPAHDPQDVIERLDESAATAWHAGADSDVQAVRECLGQLPEPYRAVVHLYYFADERRSLKDVAVQLGETHESVKKRYQRALARLQTCVEYRRQTAEELHRAN